MRSDFVPRSWKWVVLGSALLALIACHRHDVGRTGRTPSILVVLVDALRPDHLGSYGYPRPTSPSLDSLARESVRFTRAYSISSWTKPTIPSLFTSLFPTQHGVFEGNAHASRGHLESDLLPAQVRTLAEAFQSCGYATGAFVHNAHLRAEFGFGQGFDRYEEVPERAPVMARRLLDWIGESRAERDGPFLAYLHVLDVHWPYEPPEETARLMGLEEDVTSDDHALRDAVNRDYMELSDEDLETIIRRYDAEIRAVDDSLGDLLAELDRAGLTEDLAVVVTSDHGEAFLEHGYLGHGHDLYEEVVRVPLLLRLPDRASAGTVVDTRVSILDVMPTLLEMAGCPDEAVPPLEGRSLLSVLDGKEAGDGPGFAEVRQGKTYRQALWKDGWKLIRTVKQPPTPFSRPLRDGASGFEDLLGRRFEVEGMRLPTGGFVASDIEMEDSDDDDDEILGTLESIDPLRHKAQVAGFEVDFEDAVFLTEDRKATGLDAFTPGTLIKVDGEAVGPGRFVADKLTLRKGRPRTKIEGIARDISYRDESTVEMILAGVRVSVPSSDLEDAAGSPDEGSSNGDPAQGGDPVVNIELYDLRSDAGETNDLARHDSGRVTGLLAELESMAAELSSRALPRQDRVTLDEETVKKLRALGYIQ